VRNLLTPELNLRHAICNNFGWILKERLDSFFIGIEQVLIKSIRTR
jgi:hypothetical protein